MTKSEYERTRKSGLIAAPRLLLARMYGDDQLAVLADHMQAALMLAYNESRVG